MRLKTCCDCGRAFAPTGTRQARCADCAPRGNANRSPTTRARNATYWRERDRVLAGDPACHWCGVRLATLPPDQRTADHVQPVAHGGQHAGNLVPCCRRCNASRGARNAPAKRHTADTPDPTPPRIGPTRLA